MHTDEQRFGLSRSLLMLLAAGALIGDVEALDPAARDAMIAGVERTSSETSASIAKTPDRIELYSQRGDCQLFLGHFAEAVADFEKMIALDPSTDASHWRLGMLIILPANSERRRASSANITSTMGAIGRTAFGSFSPTAKSGGIEKARREMLVYNQIRP
jgi:tetratricopeptide (TPR) repeat protein